MSNDLIAFDPTQIPVAPEFREGYDPQESLADGIGSSYGIIGYKGKTWTLKHRGEKYTFTREDDGTVSNHIDVIILRQANVKSKSYYPKWENDAAEGKRPVCASMDGVYPDNDVQQRQANACGICPRNEWRTNAEGRRSRECQDYKRLAVLLTPALAKRITGKAIVEPLFLRVPPASLSALSALGDALAQAVVPFYSCITRVSFVTEINGKILAYPQFQFRVIAPLKKEDAPVIHKLREDPLAKRITGEDIIERNAAGAPRTLPAPNATLSDPIVALANRQAQEVIPPQQAPKPAPKEEPVGYGSFDDVETVNVKSDGNGSTVVAAATPTAAPVEAEDSDAALDEIVRNALVRPTPSV